MTRSWQAMFDTGDGAPIPEPDEQREGGVFARLRGSISRSRRAMTQQLQAVMFDPADEEVWERLEEALIMADCGVPATVAVIERLEAESAAGRLTSRAELTAALTQIVTELMTPPGDPRIDISHVPSVLLVTGVNGTGKTTSIGKIAWHLREAGRSCVIGAADTFRAAAGEQLETWAERAGADFVGSQSGADPAAVAFDAVSAAEARSRDVVIVDTAGRLHTQGHLMDELEKIHRVIGQRIAGAPHEVLLTIDATTGQNGLQQARLFAEAVQVTGIVLTKLDGTAKGGIAVAIAHELSIPVKLIGVGEGVEDLRPFEAADFARALFGDE
ncbi:MAG TPA: signal recognition particle-docking protein FtsY [Gaiellales bacterium]|nr:signal recognition particle-docking protein FtsY [Gaiellales bacterium]